MSVSEGTCFRIPWLIVSRAFDQLPANRGFDLVMFGGLKFLVVSARLTKETHV